MGGGAGRRLTGVGHVIPLDVGQELGHHVVDREAAAEAAEADVHRLGHAPGIATGLELTVPEVMVRVHDRKQRLHRVLVGQREPVQQRRRPGEL